MRTSARTSATPAQVWEVLGQPSRWPEFEPLLRRVRGARGAAVAGQTLLGVSRIGSLAVPLDVREVDPARRLVVRVHTAPGVGQLLSFELVPVVSGGTDIVCAVVVDGLFARVAAGPVWLASGLTVRLLAVRAERLARAARRAA